MLIDYRVCPISNIFKELDVVSTISGITGLSNDNNEIDGYRNRIKELVDKLKDSIYVCIEYPYVDKMYRDAYYKYYATLNTKVDRDCIRVSLFDIKLTKAHFSNPDLTEEITKENVFLGFFIIRPTKRIRVGRSFINPLAFKDNGLIYCQSKSISHIHGISLETKGFPHSSQDGKMHTCAETSLWMLMEYFGTKYSYFRNVLPSDILNVLKKVTHERLLPSGGLTNMQMGYVLRKFGFGSKVYMRKTYAADFDKTINDYVESGIPILAYLQSREDNSRHAYLIVGHNTIKKEQQLKEDWNKNHIELEVRSNKANISIVKVINSMNVYDKKYVIMDDNYPPYQMASIENPCGFYNLETDSSIVGVVIPLYPKVYLDNISARKLFHELLKDHYFGYKLGSKEIITRLLLTSSKSFKRFISEDEQLNPYSKYFILSSRMPKFIWLAEISTQFQFQNFKSTGFMILDSTSSENDDFEESLLFIFYSDRVIYKDPNTRKFTTREPLQEEFNLYCSNLK